MATPLFVTRCQYQIIIMAVVRLQSTAITKPLATVCNYFRVHTELCACAGCELYDLGRWRTGPSTTTVALVHPCRRRHGVRRRQCRLRANGRSASRAGARRSDARSYRSATTRHRQQTGPAARSLRRQRRTTAWRCGTAARDDSGRRDGRPVVLC